MRTKYIIISILLLVLYTVGNIYTGLRLYAALYPVLTPILSAAYWLIFSTLAAAYVVGRIGSIYFPGTMSDRLILLGAYWLGAVFYLFLLWGTVDVVTYIGHAIGMLPAKYPNLSPTLGFAIIGIVIIIVAYGTWNARTIRLQHYDLAIAKNCTIDRLNIVMVSDLHLGLLVGRDRLTKLVNVVNDLKPDLVLLAGDILDENIGAFVENGMVEVLCELQSTFGVFGCLGSHEYIWGHSEKAMKYLQAAGVTILKDDYAKIADSFYIVGRDDAYREKLVGTPRDSLCKIIAGCDQSLPIILLDHQPSNLSDGERAGVDLQLSGHTHRGQIFPLNFLTAWLFKIDWGYLRKGCFQLIVSSGFGTWASPIRVGTTSEVVQISLNFSHR